VIVELVDERDSAWENHHAHFRVYLFDTSRPGNPWATATYDVTDADLLDVVRWAEEQAGKRKLYAVALVSDDRDGRRGLTWLTGMDANDAPWDDDGQMVAHTPHEQQLIDRMLTRRGTPSPNNET
jgi:hypothetical protein